MTATAGASDPWLARLRGIALALPEAARHEGVGHPSFAVRQRIFLMYVPGETAQDDPAVWAKVPPDRQVQLLTSRPAVFFVPPDVGRFGWVGMRLRGDIDWAEVAALVEQSYRLMAPPALLAGLRGPRSSGRA